MTNIKALITTKKFILAISLISIILMFQAGTTSAAANSKGKPITLIVNGQIVQGDVNPSLIANRTFVPIRTLESLNLTFKWDTKSSSVTVNNSNLEVKLIVNQTTAYKNGLPIKMDAPTAVINGRILIPIRFISELFNFKVNYEIERVIIFINSNDYKPDPTLLESENLKEARLAAISLPWYKEFSTLENSRRNELDSYTYTFPKGEFNSYFYHNGYVQTYVKINNGVAQVIWQGDYHGGYDNSKEVGTRPNWDKILKNSIIITHDKTNKVAYGFASGPSDQLKMVPFMSYKDMAQSLSDEKK
ncbi:hypothetical protein Back11_27190 [Paenibacillus baekrokdamisoli]|uniref:Copper amine oxidase-like N-terminal domain-containing protein n=1 Tax=Paenibacillus baekrokdamisoli TaxID=1712516 RepID=A0A3G9JDV4_9BACL|nr:copper amine oxidase N-terminal domain-containing protein [Paenibacillus baekrokdamisoli]MBB3070370.1 hypothetical protein [Paenibacillus baekrokdamisoli]BBH21374.1 hypothetical protein Back11_27190 [Paenibacillus baekrokdamisoli]